MYFESFTRTCFVGDQDTYPEEEELISDVEMTREPKADDDGSEAFKT